MSACASPKLMDRIHGRPVIVRLHASLCMRNRYATHRHIYSLSSVCLSLSLLLCYIFSSVLQFPFLALPISHIPTVNSVVLFHTNFASAASLLNRVNCVLVQHLLCPVWWLSARRYLYVPPASSSVVTVCATRVVRGLLSRHLPSRIRETGNRKSVVCC